MLLASAALSLRSNGWRSCHHRVGLCPSVLVISLWMDGGVGGDAAPFDGVDNYKGPKQQRLDADLDRYCKEGTTETARSRQLLGGSHTGCPLLWLPTRVQCVCFEKTDHTFSISQRHHPRQS
jgi:hypothetical protein